MYNRSDIEYIYDGTLNGFLCCVSRAFLREEFPMRITPAANAQESLFQKIDVETDLHAAKRVWASFIKRFGRRAARVILAAYLNRDPEREEAILEFLHCAYELGPSAFSARSYAEVHRFLKLAQESENECHQFLGLLRFEEYYGGLAAVIEPKNSPLPLMRPHFIDRYPEERFLIYDRTNRLALIYKPYTWRILQVDEFTLPKMTKAEAELQLLWAQYYKTVAIKERENPRCRMNHMPKRYWKNLTEMKYAQELESRSRIIPKPQ